jgi:hypothetical protein
VNAETRGLIAGFLVGHEHAEAAHAAALLRVRREPSRRTAEAGDELAPPDFEHRLPSGQTYRSWGAFSPSVLGSKDTTPRARQIGSCTAAAALRLLHCGISVPSADGFMAEMGHQQKGSK